MHHQTAGTASARIQEVLTCLEKLRFSAAQLVYLDSPYLLNQIHLQMLAASKAVRIAHAAAGRHVLDFGLRRAHGSDAGVCRSSPAATWRRTPSPG